MRKVITDPCQVFGSVSRRRISIDYYADLLILNCHDFGDVAEFRAPHQHCTGIETIIVNGVLTSHRGQTTGRRGGRVLRKNGDAIV
jgi:N-acyl-D-aspartate/D-glutamate deacylase